MDIIIFSKDRAFQLYTSLETIQKHVSNIDNIYVQFAYSDKKYLDGYEKLNKIFNDVTFIDETVHGFQNTMYALLHSEIQSENVMLEVDDTIYYKDLDLKKCNNILNQNSNAGKYGFGFDYTIFNNSYFIDHGTHLSVNRSNTYDRELIGLVLNYPFNASSAIHRKKDLLSLLTNEQINTPVELEIKGSTSKIFNSYSTNLYNKTEVVKQIHTNNSLNRYEQVYDIETLNNFILNNEVVDINKFDIETFDTDMRWFNGEDIGRFPIFPWEIPPKHHKDIIESRKIISLSNEWWGNTKNNIIGIPLSKKAPIWKSSTPHPADQLIDLGNKGPFVNSFRDYNKDNNLENYLKDKRIAYVCPSPHLKGKKLGKLIDSYDIVVRINQAYHMKEQDWEDYGKRTDIVMNCLNHIKIDALKENMSFAESLKYIICPMVSMWDIQRVHDFLDTTKAPWHNVCDGYLFKCFNEIGTTANTGLMGIITLLNYNVKELFVTGMTFFNMNTFGKVYNDTYHDAAAKAGNFSSTENKTPDIGEMRMDIHEQQPQIDFFQRMIDKYHNNPLVLDDYLIENFVK